MTDRLDAIAAGLRDGRYDCRVPGDTDDVRWLVGEVRRLRGGIKAWEDKEVHEAMACWKDNEQLKADLTDLRQRHAEAVKQAYREGWYASAPEVITPDADFDEECDAAWLASEAKARLT